ncbi:MAG TPA: hypothetical protein VH061_15000 [Solirubrobacteraceae bacterium]|nr:hypothetical protein [Solirubrobacteraceae bacterium]
MSRLTFRRLTFLLALAVTLVLALAQSALAQAAPAPWWKLNATMALGNQVGGDEAQFVVTATDIGDEAVDGSPAPVTISYELPPGVTPIGLPQAFAGRGVPGRENVPPPLTGCEVTTQTGGRALVSCKFTEILPPFEHLLMRIPAKLEGPEDGQSVARVQGGSYEEQIPGGGHKEKTAPEAQLSKQLEFSNGPAPFGAEAFALTPELEGGAPDRQAGSHPYQLTTTLDLNETLGEFETPSEKGIFPSAVALPHDLRFKLPPGLVGNITAVPQCSKVDFSTTIAEQTVNLCPPDTAIGVVSLVANDPVPAGFGAWAIPIFNLTPEAGEPARFGFVLEGVPVILRTAVPTGGEYGVEVSVSEISQAVQLLSSQVTFWGVPGDASHDSARGWECLGEGTWYGGQPHAKCPETTDPSPRAFLTLPTSCGTPPPETTVEGHSWPAGPGRVVQPLLGDTLDHLPTEHCELLGFKPTISVEPDVHTASTPTGLSVGVHVPQTGLVSGGEQAQSAVEDTTVTLPPGLTLSPPAANGLAACSAASFGSPFPGAEEALQTQNTRFLPGPPGCNDSEKVGTVTIRTPLLPDPLTGSVYLAEEHVNPFQAPLVLYLLAEDKTAGVLVKLAGSVTPDPATGQLVSTFQNTPQLPFEDLQLHFLEGDRGSTSTPALCGSYTTSASFTPWSGGAKASPEANFAITTGAGGGPCPPNPLNFTPGFQAGSVKSGAGAFSPFVLSIARPDGQQALNGVSVHLPAGIAAILANVTPCPEPPAGQEWACDPDSLVGHAVEASGLGGEPVTLGGQVYLTTGYDGAPFGLLVRTLAAAGPFNLGYVNVRSRIDVDPHTAAVSVTTDPGPRHEAIPTILDGVPVQLKDLQVTIDELTGAGKPFEFNPTNCTPTAIAGTLSGDGGAQASVSASFTATGCASLPFKPTLTASTQGQASRVNGASLTVRVTSSPGQANIAKTVLTLPKTLPSRQSTIRQACPEKTFEANPASCDEGSVIGSAVVHTPVLKNPLTGPGYLVSHGGAAFPDVEFVLQGEGIKLVLDGQTRISKGITTSSFNTVPDAPVESFEAVLPEGPHSALGAYLPSGSYDLCNAKLTMPTTITGQNGVVISQSTKLALSGCKGVAGFKAKKLTRAQKLSRALSACRKRFKHSAKRRGTCERRARHSLSASASRGKKTHKS